MNSMVEQLKIFFKLDDQADITIEENFKLMTITFKKQLLDSNFNVEKMINSLNNLVFENDMIYFTDRGDDNQLDNYRDISDFNDYLTDNDNTINLKIRKLPNKNFIYVYSISDFLLNMYKNYKIEGLLAELTSHLYRAKQDYKKLTFILHQSNFDENEIFLIQSEGIAITNECLQHPQSCEMGDLIIESLESHSNIITNNSFTYTNPLYLDFNNGYNSNVGELVELLRFIGQMLCTMYLADYVIIKKDIIKLKYGNSIIQFDNSNVENLFDELRENQYLSIFRWVFAEDSSNFKPEKLVILRNVVGKEISDNSLSLAPSTFEAIKSSFNFYVQGHTEIYLNTKQKIMSDINDMIQGYEDNLNLYIGSFKQSFLAIISFLFATVGLDILKGKTITGISSVLDLITIFLIILYILYIYKIIAYFEFFQKCGLIMEQYNGLKSSYIGTLNLLEIEEIFEKASPMKKVMNSYKRLQSIYNIFWDTLIAIPILIAFVISNYEHKIVFMCIYFIVVLIVAIIDINLFLNSRDYKRK